MEKLNSSNFAEKTSKGIALVDFYTEWCGVCKMLHPFLIKAEKELKELNVSLYELDCDAEEALSNEYKINFVPDVVLLVDGKIKDRFVGMKTKDKIIEFVKNNI